MNAHSFHTQEEDRSSDSSSHLSIMMLYEDADTRKCAQGVYEFLVQEFEHNLEFDCTWCHFDDLKSPDAAQDATWAAADANLIFFATKTDTEPSATVKSWVETWLESKDAGGSALVALMSRFGGHRRAILPYKDYLRGIAERSHMDFLSHVVDMAEGKFPRLMKLDPARTMSPRGAPLDDARDTVRLQEAPPE